MRTTSCKADFPLAANGLFRQMARVTKLMVSTGQPFERHCRTTVSLQKFLVRQNVVSFYFLLHALLASLSITHDSQAYFCKGDYRVGTARTRNYLLHESLVDGIPGQSTTRSMPPAESPLVQMFVLNC